MKTLALKNLSILLTPQQLLQRILEIAAEETGASSGSLILLNPNTGSLDIEASFGLSPEAQRIKLRIGEGITGWVASTGRPMRLNDVLTERRYVSIDQTVRSELAVPLDLNGQVIGIINLDSTIPGAFSDEHEKRLIDWAREASEWIKLSWEIDQLRVKGQQLESLVDMGQTIVSQEGLDDVLSRITADTHRLMHAKISSLMLLSDDNEELVLKAWHGASRAYVRKPNLLVRESLVGVVVNRQKPLTVLNVQDHHRYQHTELAKREGLFSLLSVPLVFQGKALGVLSVYTGQLHRFSNEEIRLLTAMAGLSAVAIAKARILEHVVQTEENLRASERLSALGLLAAEIAHEIRNPLAVMQMLFHAMMKNLPLDEGTARDASLIETKMQQMNRIVDQVLTFAQSSEPCREWIDAGQVVDDILLLTRHKLDDLNIDVKITVPEEELPLEADRTQLEQAILNLVLNASQAMPKGGTLHLSAREKRSRATGRQVIISVGDTGEGMSRKRLEEIFQPFLSHRHGGTGLGLALVRRAVENHGGKIEVKSKPKRGTVFEMIFPANMPPEK